MKGPLFLIVSLVGAVVLASPSPSRAEPASHESIEWATANSDRVIIAKIVKVETVSKHSVVTVEVHQTLRGDQEPKVGDLHPKMTFLMQEYCSGYAQGWLEDGLPMMFFLVKFDGAKRRDQLPEGFKWVLHDDGNGNSAVLLGKTKRIWPGTIDVFTQKFDYLTMPAAIIKFVGDYARSIPPDRIEKSITVKVPYGTPAYRKVFPPQYPGNAFFLRVPEVEQKNEQVPAVDRTIDQPIGPQEASWYVLIPLMLGALVSCICIGYVARRWLKHTRDIVPPKDALTASPPRN